MTDERKQAEAILNKTLEDNCFWLSETEGNAIVKAMESYASLKVAEATKEMYPKAELKVPTKDEIINHFTKEHYHYQEGRYTRVDKDRIFGAQWAINWIRENNK
jgi:hypothetical protein